MDTVMSMNMIDKNMELVDKLETVLENIMFRIELESLTEATDENGNKTESKDKVKFGQLAKNTIRTIIDKLLEILDPLIKECIYLIRVKSGKDAILNKDMTVSVYCEQKISSDISRLCDVVLQRNSNEDNILDDFSETLRLMDKKKDYREGDRINIKRIYDTLIDTKKNLKKLRRANQDDMSPKAKSVLSEVIKFHKSIMSDCKSLIANTKSLKKAEKNANNQKSNIDRGESETMENNESITIPYGMTRNEYVASIMLEAADLLKDDVIRDSSEVKELSDIPVETPVKQNEYNTATVGGDDEKPDLEEIKDLCDNDPDVVKLLTDDEDKSVTVDSTKNAIQEAIDLLYDKAILCEDAGEAAEYVQKAEELQKAIEDIPEETPVKQDDYETSTVGGDDEKPDLEEIKDLCDNDPEVIKLLTDDEDKSVTVDSDGETNTESAFNFFDLDF